MKKFKKTISIILVLAMIFGISSFPALADCDQNNICTAEIMAERRFGKDFCDKQIVEKVESDMESLKEHLTVDDLEISRILDDGSIEYVYQYTEDYIDYLRILSYDKNEFIVTIEENELKNTIKFCGNELYVDDYKIDISNGEYAEDAIGDLNIGEVVSPMSRTSMYSKTPYKGTASDYTIGCGLHYKHSAIDTVQTIKSLAVTTIQIIITKALSLKTAYKLLFDSISLALAANARENAPTSHYLSCKIWKYELANGSTAMNRYYKYSGRYYVKSDYTGSYVSGNYYEHNFFS